ncbi:hypothetical protein RN01_29815 [Cupriavidus sp. SHE]|uniref:STY1053 family phage-associated protein n=1 Tax=Cupriavidus TaxID=106589 RepID=UPI00046B7134|nr:MULTISPECIES: hypothetical protein [Cupriavidus]KWR75313.1 hypothetical protein RN01_29815 [Cupriavidus sp. SHE]
MPKIYVKKAFTLHHKDEKHEFPVGNHSVPAEVAEHWYVKAHTGDEPAVDPESAAVADELLAELDAKAKALQELADKLAEREKAADQREADLNGRAEALDTREVAISEREKAAEAAAKAGKGK